MHLSPRELDKLTLHQAGFLAQKRLARGVRLNHPEAVALIATVILEFIRDGRSVAELMNVGRQLLGRNQVMPGVPEMIYDVQVEGTFPDGTKLVTVHHPIASENGNLVLAMHGSFLPVPGVSVFTPVADEPVPGSTEIKEGEIELNVGRATVELPVTNLGDRPIQVGSHYHFIETNASLKFDRGAAYGKRLDIPAGTAVRFEPGEMKTVKLVEIAGKKVIRGGNNLASGKVSAAGKKAALKRVKAKGFMNTVNASPIDEAILASVGQSWRKVAIVISKAEATLGSGIPEGERGLRIVAEHIKTLVRGGRLVAQGDINKWRHSEVRQP